MDEMTEFIYGVIIGVFCQLLWFFMIKPILKNAWKNSKIPLEPPEKNFRNPKSVKIEMALGSTENKKLKKRV